MLRSKMDKIVTEYYAKKKQILKPIESGNNSVIVIDSLKRVNGFCKSDSKSFFTVPLLFYYYSKEKILCRVNPKIYANAILSEIDGQLNTGDANRKLAGKTIEVIFSNIPSFFYHNYAEHFLVIQYANLSFAKEEVYNPAGDLRINFVIRDNQTSQIIKKGRVTEQFINTYFRKNYGERRNTFIHQ